MLKRTVSICLITIVTYFPMPGNAETPESAPIRPVHTFSIVARDTTTGELGVAVQSHWFAVGTKLWQIGAGPDALGQKCARIVTRTPGR